MNLRYVTFLITFTTIAIIILIAFPAESTLPKGEEYFGVYVEETTTSSWWKFQRVLRIVLSPSINADNVTLSIRLPEGGRIVHREYKRYPSKDDTDSNRFGLIEIGEVRKGKTYEKKLPIELYRIHSGEAAIFVKGDQIIRPGLPISHKRLEVYRIKTRGLA